MLPWIIQSGIISFVLIYLIHYLFTFFKNNLTVPKVIDLVNKPDMSNIKNELKNYLKDLKSKSPSMENGMASNMVFNSTNSIPPTSNTISEASTISGPGTISDARSNSGFPESANMGTSNYSTF